MDDALTRAAPTADAMSQHGQLQLAIERLGALAEDLDRVVRQEIRSAFVEEFQMLGAASQRAAEALHGVRRAASMRVAAWAIALVFACSAIPVVVSWAVIPSRAALTQMRRERDELAADVDHLQRQGGKIDLRRCGAERRVCVRIDRSAPAYGPQADYLVVKGY
ncbi:MAG: hypothetical protein WBE92_17535 [Steroidobacteraceae bacterium]